MSKQYGYWKFDGQVRWFIKFKIPLTIDTSWGFNRDE